MMNIQELAQKYRNQASLKTRNDGSEYWNFDYENEEDLYDMCLFLYPNDQVMEWVIDALDAVAYGHIGGSERVPLYPDLCSLDDAMKWMALNPNKAIELVNAYSLKCIQEEKQFDLGDALLYCVNEEVRQVFFHVVRSLEKILGKENLNKPQVNKEWAFQKGVAYAKEINALPPVRAALGKDPQEWESFTFYFFNALFEEHGRNNPAFVRVASVYRTEKEKDSAWTSFMEGIISVAQEFLSNSKDTIMAAIETGVQ